jgi:hypothetical protein
MTVSQSTVGNTFWKSRRSQIGNFMQTSSYFMQRTIFVGGFALMLSCLPASAKAQQNSARPDATDQAASTNRPNPNPDLTRDEVAKMDQFLDDHKNIDKDLREKPSLINDEKYLDHHKELRTFLSDHPGIRE